MKTFNSLTRTEKDIFHTKNVLHFNYESVNRLTLKLLSSINDCPTLETLSRVFEDTFAKITDISNNYLNSTKHETDNKENTH